MSTYEVSLIDTDRGRRIEVAREVDAPAAAAWDLLVDATRWTDWGPSVTAVDYPPGRIAAGTAGRVRAFGLLWVPFEIRECDDETRRWTWSTWGRTPPADGHRVDDLDVGPGADRCLVALECPLWALWYVPICLVALRNVAREARTER